MIIYKNYIYIYETLLTEINNSIVSIQRPKSRTNYLLFATED